MNDKPVLYVSARHSSSYPFRRTINSLSNHVRIVEECKDPETAYSLIARCDTFLLYLNTELCRNLFSLYELGVALVLGIPVIVIRDKILKVTDIVIPKHFSETRLLIPDCKKSTYQTCDAFGTKKESPLSLADVLSCSYENSLVLSPKSHISITSLLVDKITNLSYDVKKVKGKSRKTNHDHSESLAKHKATFEGSSCFPAIRFTVPHRSLFPSNRSKKLKTISLHTENKFVKLPASGVEDKSRNENVSKVHTSNYKEKKIFEVNNEKSSIRAKQGKSDLATSLKSKIDDDAIVLTDDFYNSKEYDGERCTPLPSPIRMRSLYYPTALPVYPMEKCFPPFQIEKLHFNRHAVKISKSDKFPSIVRRRIIRKE